MECFWEGTWKTVPEAHWEPGLVLYSSRKLLVSAMGGAGFTYRDSPEDTLNFQCDFNMFVYVSISTFNLHSNPCTVEETYSMM